MYGGAREMFRHERSNGATNQPWIEIEQTQKRQWTAATESVGVF